MFFFPNPDLTGRITVESDKRGGKPCIRNMRITVHDVLGWLSAGMNVKEIILEYPELEHEDIVAALQYATKQVADAA